MEMIASQILKVEGNIFPVKISDVKIQRETDKCYILKTLD